MMIHVGENKERRESGRVGWKVEVRSKCEQFIGLGRQCERLC